VDNKITIINEVDVENYLKATLSDQIQTSYDSAVLDAMAIAARTQIYYQIQHHERAFWHIDAQDIHYKGHALTHFKENVLKAVDNTKFLVMTYEKKTFPTTWNENCAGKTASYASIFRKNIQSPAGIKSAFSEKTRKDHHWTLTIPKSKLTNLAQTNRITQLELYVDPQSDKVYAIRIQDGSHIKELSFFELQKHLGTSNLLSNDFTVSMEGNNITFEGYGSGCGVGLCLYSAKEMAKRGDTAPEILSLFYPYTHVEQIRTLSSDPAAHYTSTKLKKIKNKELENPKI
jgi:stage II sporulation protein D